MIEIILDASQLEVFEPCPRKWYYSEVENLTPNRRYNPVALGSYYHTVLDHYYDLGLSSNPPEINTRFKSAIEFSQNPQLLETHGIKDIEKIAFHKRRLVDYFCKYMEEDEAIEVIAVEKGFSWILYEDSNRRYILEGKIDLVGVLNPYGLFVMDHKTQSRKDDRFEFNHQVCNYMSFTKANYFIYNYIGLQDKLPPEGMRRVIYQPPPGMLEQWQSEVLHTFDQMYTIELAKQDNPKSLELLYERRRSACDSNKYGLCQYHKLCSVPDNTIWCNVVRSAYKEKSEKWKAWK